jgi:predicted Zn-dependent protease
MRVAVFAFFCLTIAAQDRLLDKEVALGMQLAKEVRRSTTPIESQAIQNYVSQLGAKLTAQLPSGAFPYTFSVVNGLANPLHEPLTLPGGYIFIPLSLLLNAREEAELAGMFAQAIARPPHLIKGNGTIPLIFVGSFAGTLLPASALQQRRGALELEADKSAALMMSRAGFDPAALLRYIERVQPADRPFLPFPPRAARIAAFQDVIRDLAPVAQTDGGEFLAVQEQARSEAPEPPEQPRPVLKRQ